MKTQLQSVIAPKYISLLMENQQAALSVITLLYLRYKALREREDSINERDMKMFSDIADLYNV